MVWGWLAVAAEGKGESAMTFWDWLNASVLDLILAFLLGGLGGAGLLLLWAMLVRCAEMDDTDERERGIRRS